VHPKELTLRFDEPLFGVGVGDHVGRGLVGDDVVEQVGLAGVGELVGLAGREQQAVAGHEGVHTVRRARLASPAQDDEQLPLGGVGVQGLVGGPGWHAGQLHGKGVATTPGAHVLDAAQSEREVLAVDAKLAGGRALLAPGQLVLVGLLHGESATA
jgi:hypothetical protein